MSTADYDGKLIVEKYVRLYFIVSNVWLETEYKVNFALLKQFQQFLHCATDDIEPHSGILRGKFLHRFHQNRRKGIRNAYVKNSGQHLLEVTDLRKALIGVLKRTPGYRQEAFPVFREHNSVRVTLEKVHAQFLLQTAHLLRKRALSDEQLPGSLGEIEGFRSLYEIFQLSEFHKFQLVFEILVVSNARLDALWIIYVDAGHISGETVGLCSNAVDTTGGKSVKNLEYNYENKHCSDDDKCFHNIDIYIVKCLPYHYDTAKLYPW